MENKDKYSIQNIQAQQLDSWLDFVVKCFSEKSNPPSKHYFHRHILNDQNFDLNDIWVLVDSETQEYLSTIKLVPRHHYLDGKVYSGVGLAEVCTKKECRGGGLGGKILNFVVDLIKKASKYQLSILFAGPQVNQFYSKRGYQNLQERKLLIKLKEAKKEGALQSVKKVTEIGEGEAEQLAQLHAQMSVHFKLAFNVFRDKQYFLRWV